MAKIIKILLISFLLLESFSAQSPYMPNTTKILSVMFGITSYQPYIVPGSGSEVTESEILWNASEIFSMKDNEKFGAFFVDGGIDRLEEYCTAYIILNASSGYATLDQTIKAEFSSGKEKYLRLLAIWLKAKGLYGYYFSEYFDVFPMIYAAAKKEGFVISEQESKEYFYQSIEKQIRSSFTNSFSLAKMTLTESTLNIFITIWKNFILNPGDETYLEQHTFSGMLYLLGESSTKYKAIDTAYIRGVALLCGEDYLYGWELVRYDYSSHEEEANSFRSSFIKSLGIK